MTILHEQIVAYESMQQSLESNHFGKCVVFHDKVQSGLHDSLESAAQSVVVQFGDDPYLIREIGAANRLILAVLEIVGLAVAILKFT